MTLAASVQILGPSGAQQGIRLPELRSWVACGFPSPAEDFMGDELDLGALCIQNPVATFFARAEGDSMRPFGIEHGDLLVIDRSIQAKDGDIALVLWDGGLTVKQVRIRRGLVELVSGDSRQPIPVQDDVQLEVWGVVTWSFKKQWRR